MRIIEFMGYINLRIMKCSIIMKLKRKMYNRLLTLKNTLNGQKALLIEGARHIGKSTICEEFGRNEYKSYILIDFAKCPNEVKDYFQKHMDDLDTFLC